MLRGLVAASAVVLLLGVVLFAPALNEREPSVLAHPLAKAAPTDSPARFQWVWTECRGFECMVSIPHRTTLMEDGTLEGSWPTSFWRLHPEDLSAINGLLDQAIATLQQGVEEGRILYPLPRQENATAQVDNGTVSDLWKRADAGELARLHWFTGCIGCPPPPWFQVWQDGVPVTLSGHPLGAPSYCTVPCDDLKSAWLTLNGIGESLSRAT